jgi:hypothetical protein
MVNFYLPKFYYIVYYVRYDWYKINLYERVEVELKYFIYDKYRILLKVYCRREFFKKHARYES